LENLKELESKANNQLNNLKDLKAALMEGAVLRVRPKAMTVAVIIAGLYPIMQGHGTVSFGDRVHHPRQSPLIHRWECRRGIRLRV